MANAAIDQLITTLESSDSPYRCWAALAMRSARDASRRDAGKKILIEIADSMPSVLDHSDLSAYALLSAEYLGPQQSSRLSSSFPDAHENPLKRSRFYRSSALVYLAARGLRDRTPHCAAIVRLVLEDLRAMCGREAPDIPSLVLRLATLFELDAHPVEDATFRAVAGRFVAAARENETAIAARWLIERYHERLQTSDAGQALTAAQQLGDSDGALPEDVAVARPWLTAMALEVALLREPAYELLPSGHAAAAAARSVGRQRFAAAVAFGMLIYGAGAAGIALAIRLAGFPVLPTVTATICFTTPLALLAVVMALGRRVNIEGIGGGLITGTLYLGLLLLSKHYPAIRPYAVGENALFSAVPSMLLTAFTALQGARKSTTEAHRIVGDD